jgi:hypothetical protein
LLDLDRPRLVGALHELTVEIRLINERLGWRPTDNTFGDDMALIHSEVSEALDAYRQWGMTDATSTVVASTLHKPEGVGSEFADILIRLLDVADRRRVDLVYEVIRKLAYNETRGFRHGGKLI